MTGAAQQPAMYCVGENTRTQLDLQGEKIPGALAERYVLRKVSPGVTEKYWRLTGLFGNPVERSDAQSKEAHLVPSDNKVQEHV